jgi:hypothetical protein
LRRFNLYEAAVTEDIGIMTATDTITVVEGYDAMRIFLETVWRRHGKTTRRSNCC